MQASMYMHLSCRTYICMCAHATSTCKSPEGDGIIGGSFRTFTAGNRLILYTCMNHVERASFLFPVPTHVTHLVGDYCLLSCLPRLDAVATELSSQRDKIMVKDCDKKGFAQETLKNFPTRPQSKDQFWQSYLRVVSCFFFRVC